MKRVMLNVLLGLCIAVMTGCGFHLRGEMATALPASLKTIYMQGVSTQSGLGLELKRLLSRNGINVLQDYQEGAAVLTVLQNKIDKRVLSVGSNAKASEYELDGLVKFQVSDGKGQLLMSPQEVEAQRNYIFDQNQVLAMGDEESMLREEMVKQMAQSIMRRLAAIK